MNPELRAILQSHSVETLQSWMAKPGNILHENIDEIGNTPLLLAAFYGRKSIVDFLLSLKGVSINEKNNHNESALIQAIRGKHVLLAQQLIDKGISLSDRVRLGFTPLLFAAQLGNISIFELLLKKGASLSERDFDGNSVLLWAFYSGEIPLVQSILKKGRFFSFIKRRYKKLGIFLSQKNGLGESPIFLAVRSRNMNMINFALTLKGVSLAELDHHRNTVLHHAAYYGDIALFDYLFNLIKKKNITLPESNVNGYTSLLFAVSGCQIEMFKHLIKNYHYVIADRSLTGDSALEIAAIRGLNSMIEYLLTLPDFSLLDRNKSGFSALALAAWHKRMDTVICLLHHGAFFDQEVGVNSFRQMLEQQQNVKCLELYKKIEKLMEFASEDSKETKESKEAEDSTEPKDPDNLIKSLLTDLEKSIKKEQRDAGILPINARQIETGNTALHWAVKREKRVFVQALIERGARFDLYNKDYRTALYYMLYSDDIFLKTLGSILKIRHLEESKETKEKKDVEEALSKALQGLETASKILNSEEMDFLNYQLGLSISNPKSNVFNPKLCYEILSRIEKTNISQFKKANTILFRILQEKVNEKDEKFTITKAALKHLLQSDIENISVVEYIKNCFPSGTRISYNIMRAHNLEEALFIIIEEFKYLHSCIERRKKELQFNELRNNGLRTILIKAKELGFSGDIADFTKKIEAEFIEAISSLSYSILSNIDNIPMIFTYASRQESEILGLINLKNETEKESVKGLEKKIKEDPYSCMLIPAIQKGDLSLLKYLLIKPEINLLIKVPPFNHNVITIAAIEGKCEVIRLLLRYGAYVDMELCNGFSSQEFICKNTNRSTQKVVDGALKLLALADTDYCPPFEMESVLTTLDKDVNARMVFTGNTALHLAITRKNRSLVAMLLKHDANLEIENHSKLTPLQAATRSKDFTIVAMVHIEYIKRLIKQIELEKRKLEKEVSRFSKSSILSLGVEKKEEDEKTKEIIEMEEKLKHSLKIAVEALENFRRLGHDGGELCLSLGEMLSNPLKIPFEPVVAYQVLTLVGRTNLNQFQKANAILFELVVNRQFDFKISRGEEDESDKLLPFVKVKMAKTEGIEPDQSRSYRIRMAIKHLLFAESDQEEVLGHLIAEYCFGSEKSIEGLKDIKGKGVDSIIAIIELAQNMLLENTEVVEKIQKAQTEAITLKNLIKEFSLNPGFVTSLLTQFKEKTESRSESAEPKKEEHKRKNSKNSIISA